MEVELVDALAAEVVSQGLSASDSPVTRRWSMAKISPRPEQNAKTCKSLLLE